jgi:hypothetical protein
MTRCRSSKWFPHMSKMPTLTYNKSNIIHSKSNIAVIKKRHNLDPYKESRCVDYCEWEMKCRRDGRISFGFTSTCTSII